MHQTLIREEQDITRIINDQIDIGSIESENSPICFTNDSQLQINDDNKQCINIIDLINSNPVKIYTIHGANKIEVNKIISTDALKTLIQINPTQDISIKPNPTS